VWTLLISDVPGRAGIIAKLEKPAAIASLESILAETDAVMVARGDLGVEMPTEQVPAIQKRIVRACRQRGLPVIVATQMVDFNARGKCTMAKIT
jgi:pyruvate kinase